MFTFELIFGKTETSRDTTVTSNIGWGGSLETLVKTFQSLAWLQGLFVFFLQYYPEKSKIKK